MRHGAGGVGWAIMEHGDLLQQSPSPHLTSDDNHFRLRHGLQVVRPGLRRHAPHLHPGQLLQHEAGQGT